LPSTLTSTQEASLKVTPALTCPGTAGGVGEVATVGLGIGLGLGVGGLTEATGIGEGLEATGLGDGLTVGLALAATGDGDSTLGVGLEAAAVGEGETAGVGEGVATVTPEFEPRLNINDKPPTAAAMTAM
jgi:hypothetical protein